MSNAPCATLLVRRWAEPGQLAALRQPWDALAAGQPFRCFDWLTTWWQHYSGWGRELCVLTVSDESGDVLGVAPWFIEPSAACRTVRWLGSGEVCSDWLGVLARPGHEAAVGQALGRWLDTASVDTWDLVELCATAVSDPAMAALLGCLASAGYQVDVEAELRCWRRTLPTSWEALLAGLSKSHRKQLRRCEARYLNSGRAALREARSADELSIGLNILARLHTRRWRSLGRAGVFASPRYTSFLTDAAARLLPSGTLRLFWLELDGAPAAAEFHLAGAGCLYAYQSGIEPTALAHQPGRLTTAAILRRAIDQGFNHFDLLRGDEPYKAHWRAEPVTFQTARIVGRSPAARLQHRLWRARRELKRWVKASFGRGPSSAAKAAAIETLSETDAGTPP